MKKIVSLLAAAVLVLGLCAAFPAARVFAYTDGSVDIVRYIGELTPTKFDGIWDAPTANTLAIITPGNSVTGLYYEKLCARYDEALDCYVVTKKIANHRGGAEKVEKGCIGLCLNYAPLTGAGSGIAKSNWYVWQYIRPGDRLRLGADVDLKLKNLSISGVWGTSTYKNDSRIAVERVCKVYPALTPYSNRRIVAQGDSITVGGGWTSDWSDYLSCKVINSGFGGDTAHHYMAENYEKYVKAFDPEIVFVCFGINDALRESPTQALIDKYKTALGTIYEKNTELGAKTVFTTPNNIKVELLENGGKLCKGDPSAFGGAQGYIDTFFQGMRDVAAEKGCLLIDVYKMWRDEELAPSLLMDSVHPKGEGYDRNLVLQKEFLVDNMAEICGTTIRAMEGSPVSCVLDALPECEKTVRDAEGVEVTDVNAVLQNGFTVSYRKNGADLGTFTVETFAPDGVMFKESAPFVVGRDGIVYEEGLKVSDVIDNILNPGVSATDADGNALAPDDEAAIGTVISVEGFEDKIAVVAKEESSCKPLPPDPYEGWELGENILKGRSYTAEYNAFWQKCSDEDSVLLTDGFYRGDGATKWNGPDSVPGVTVEYAGTYATTSVTFVFDEPTDIHLITFRNVRLAGNRGFEMGGVGVSEDGKNFTNIPFTVTLAPVAGAPGGVFFNVCVRADAVQTKGLKLSFGTGGEGYYIVQADEIEAAAYVEPSGDVNGDGMVDNLDASIILQYDAGLMDNLERFDFADVNGDNAVDNLDAALILQYDAGLIEDFRSVGN